MRTLRLEEQARVDLAVGKLGRPRAGHEAEEPLRQTRFAVREKVGKVLFVDAVGRTVIKTNVRERCVPRTT
jgi:hypothetical protein